MRISAAINNAFPNEGEINRFGIISQDNKGVYLYVDLSYGDPPLITYSDASLNTR